MNHTEEVLTNLKSSVYDLGVVMSESRNVSDDYNKALSAVMKIIDSYIAEEKGV